MYTKFTLGGEVNNYAYGIDRMALNRLTGHNGVVPITHTTKDHNDIEDTNLSAAWNRLQCLSCEHSVRIYVARKHGASASRARAYCRTGTSVPHDIADNVDILGRGNEEEIKARVLWYVQFFPDIFNTCSKRGWTLT